jgi:hypothetical protein
MLKTAPFLFVLLFTRCISYVPLSYHGSGSSLTAKIEAKEATMYLQHINHQYQHLVFDFEVNNQSSDTVALAPEQISYYFSATRFSKKEFNQLEDGVSTLRLNKSRFARSTTEVHELFQRKERSRATVGAIFTLISVGLIIYDETKDNSDSRKRYLSEKDVRQAATRDAIVTAGLLAADIANKSKATICLLKFSEKARSNQMRKKEERFFYLPKKPLPICGSSFRLPTNSLCLILSRRGVEFRTILFGF